ncbi:hypothetical protein OOK58_42200 [Streptomyces sp. NBC_01728]|uniref:hypothetical protein n=1 Tax=unclassified Streptomyces TaxID=2593676 RepID=UPI00225743A7|nr:MULTISPECIES: hypothetical protein [unclassified Streptomyces]MCX4458528.1 hypothetical protein [Streptomyces sp. NBC_01719]MCX4497885.1 hypothetical protein [Streptomyces sp. NBC_01728]
MHTTLAAGMANGQVLGAYTLSGAALIAGTGMFLGLRGSDFKPIVINDKKRATWWGIVTGTIWAAAGGTWTDIAEGIGSVPTSVLKDSADFGNPGQGAIATFLVLIAFGPRWGSRTLPPGIIGIAAAVTFGTAGGIWTILVNIVKMIVSIFVTKVS